ncbi:at-hook motif nuclear-localized protein 6, partial [Quercus suber]
MEEKESSGSGVAVKGEEAPDGFRVAPRTENPTQLAGPPTIVAASPVSVAAPSTEGKKKRGRPRKYGPDGAGARAGAGAGAGAVAGAKAASLALSPMPISSSIPLTGEFSAWKRGRGRPVDSVKKSHKYEYESPGERIAYSVGANFTPHVITVNAGEGRFEILSLCGSFMPTDNGGTKSRSGGMSVSLAGPDGRVVGGGLAGLLVAAALCSFLPGHQQEQKPKKQRIEPTSTIPASPRYDEETRGPILTSSTAFHGDNSASINPIQGFRNSAVDIKTSMPEEGSKGPSQLNCE